ncbi:UNVERIFIED_CONTAM: polyprotein [Sesamum latifolium]|uniref:Polyprotein n=1 Tax=Sesamum latifolium TaxID=2727402 RepID=A0AAW2WD77_9LAMI
MKKKSLRFFRRRLLRNKKTDRCYLCEQDEHTEDTVFAIHDDSSKGEDENSTVELVQHWKSTFQPHRNKNTMLNPEVLPDDAWRTHYEYFQAADGQRFSISLISKKPVGIRFFTECIIWMHVIDNKLHGRDLLIGFVLYHKAQRLQVLPMGLKYKRYFQSFSTIPRIFAIILILQINLKQCCADSHADFKHPHLLWKNPEFFIQLPFKLNEDANSIKASHPGMTPNDLALAREECSQLLALGLIKPTKSNWACLVFYVNKKD